MASCPTTTTGPGVDHPASMNEVGGCALQTGPYPPGLSRHAAYGISTTGSLALHLLISLGGPASSGRADTSRRCRGCFPPSPAFPGLSGRTGGLLRLSTAKLEEPEPVAK